MLLGQWSDELARLNAIRRLHGQHYVRHVSAAADYGPLAYLRFPVVLDDPSAKATVLVERNGRALGISGMYPATVATIPQLQGRLPEGRYPEAERVASSLVTLPTHALLSTADREQVCALMNRAAHGSPDRPRPAVAMSTRAS